MTFIDSSRQVEFSNHQSFYFMEPCSMNPCYLNCLHSRTVILSLAGMLESSGKLKKKITNLRVPDPEILVSLV